VKRLHTGILPFLAAIPTVAAALDLTPVENWRSQEGVRINTLVFNDPTGKIRYQPPGDWRIDGDTTTLSLHPPQQESFMQFRLFQRKPEAANAPAEDLAKWACIFLAPDAADVTLLETRPSPFTLCGHPSQEFIHSFSAGGQRFQMSMAICDLNERERLVVIITARSADFAAVHGTGIASLFSWSKRK